MPASSTASRSTEFALEDWRRVMAINLDGVFLVGQAAARRMIPRGSGKIINICSLTSELARPPIAPYAAAKGAVKMLTKAMCGEWARHGIQVNGIGPGYFKTEHEPRALHRSRIRQVACAGARPPAAGASCAN